ncbi:MAG TPA: alpha/beta fold hydrolase [Candidatus Avacidaminococcus intestinavium]|uniref:Alpha/beta fold hydrolase n=1 Tax=Candidatus Avacidaminococcus intestinavium TaxID=2840684 RepID=A0A9D1MQE6_9FIRM|nr:alpha/beta fold hydrolase [Candidatus Avacidaminococcus intestinavium]
MKIMDGAEQYYWPSGKQGVLLIHGYTGSPAELKLLGEFLYQAGYSVLGVRLPGHGTTPEELNSTTWHDWYAKVMECYLEIQKDCREVSVIGLSMGALLAMKLASEQKIDKAVFLSAPIYIYDKRIPLVFLAKNFIKWIKKGKRSYSVPEQYNVAYSVMPLKALDSLLRLIKHIKKDVLKKITRPCLIIQSKKEHTVRPESADYIFQKIRSKQKKLLWVEQGGHILTLSDERKQVFFSIKQFLEE